jgi:hypothetical protein
LIKTIQMHIPNHFSSRPKGRLLAFAAFAGLLCFVAFNSGPARATVAAPPVSDSPGHVLYGPALRAAQDSVLSRYPFLRRIHSKDAKGRPLDIFGRPVGC